MWEMLIHHPLFGLFLTLAIFYICQQLQKRLGQSPFLSPLILTIIVITGILAANHIEYDLYMKGAQWLSLMIGPATVALAVPLYKQLPILKKNMLAIMIVIFVGALLAPITAIYLARSMHADLPIQTGLLTKSVTTPIAMGIAERLNLDAALAVFFIFVTGIVGSLLMPGILKLCKVTDDQLQGLVLGITCHVLGIARAMQISEQAGAFAALGMSLTGLCSAIIIPYCLYQLIF